VAEGRVLDGGEMLGDAQARVNVGIRQAGASYKCRTSCVYDVSFTAFGSLGVVPHCHERHEEDSL